MKEGSNPYPGREGEFRILAAPPSVGVRVKLPSGDSGSGHPKFILPILSQNMIFDFEIFKISFYKPWNKKIK